MTETNTQKAHPTEETVLLYLKDLARDEFGISPEKAAQIELDTSLVEGMYLDSLAQAILITNVEEHYALCFELEDREQLQTVKTVRDFVQVILARANNREI